MYLGDVVLGEMGQSQDRCCVIPLVLGMWGKLRKNCDYWGFGGGGNGELFEAYRVSVLICCTAKCVYLTLLICILKNG